MDKYRRMEIFVAVAEAGQLTRAAKRLQLSKSAVSHALTDLEKYLNLELLMRHSRGWRLTVAGSSYYTQCKKILTHVEIMEDKVRQDKQGSQNLSGFIRISSPGTFGANVLTPIISKFMEMHPNIMIELNLMEVLGDLIEERVDIAFRSPLVRDKDPKNNKLEIHKIGDTEMVMCASPAYLKAFGAPKSHLDLKKHKCIMFTRIPTWTFSKDGRHFEHTPEAHLITDNAETMREFCIHGQGLGFFSSSFVTAALKKGKLVPFLENYDCGTVEIQAVRVKDKHAPARVIQLLHYIINEIRGNPTETMKFVQEDI